MSVILIRGRVHRVHVVMAWQIFVYWCVGNNIFL
jgi:hypothetical protein